MILTPERYLITISDSEIHHILRPCDCKRVAEN